MQTLGLPELTEEQIKDLSSIAEETARRHIYSKIPIKQIETLNITAETEGSKPVTLTLEIELTTTRHADKTDVKKTTNEATKAAFASVEEHLRRLACPSPR